MITVSPEMSHFFNIFSVQSQDASHEPQHIGTLGFGRVEVPQEQVTHQDPAEKTSWATMLGDDVIQG